MVVSMAETQGKTTLRMAGSDSVEINGKRWRVFWEGAISATTKKHQNEYIKHTRHLRSKEICQNREKEDFFYGRSTACQSNWRREEVQKKTQSSEQLSFSKIFFCVFKVLKADITPSFWKMRRNALPSFPAAEKPTFLTRTSTSALYPPPLQRMSSLGFCSEGWNSKRG